MADQRITQLTALPKAGVAATDVLPIADISASQTKKVTAKDLVDAGLDLVDASSIDLAKLDQSSTTKLGTTAFADDAITSAKLADDSTIAVESTAPTTNNYEGRGWLNSTNDSLSVYKAGSYTPLLVQAANLPTGVISTAAVADGAITTAKVTALGTAALANSAVTTAKLADAAITTAKIAADAITASQVATGAIGASELADDAVDTAAIVDAAVTAAKLATGAVTTTKLNDAAVTTTKVADTSITYAKLDLADGDVPGSKLTDSSVIEAKLGSSAVTTSKINDNAVTYTKLQNTSSTDVVLGRSTAGAGNVEEIACTAAGRALLDDVDAAAQRNTLGLGTLATQSGTFSGTHSGNSSGTNTGDQTITLTGDVTGSGTNSFAATIGNAAVTEAKLATDAVTTAKVLDDAITAAKLANNSAAVVAAATPSGSGAFTGQQWIDTNTKIEYTWDGSAWVQQAGVGTISFVDSTPISFAVNYPDPYSATITTTLDTQGAALVFAGPSSGANATPTFRALVPGDLPDATASTKGIIQPGTGLAISSGTLNHAASITAGTVSGITYNASGHITAATALVAGDIPSLDASKITSGTFATALVADDAITAAKMANYSTAQIGETLPAADYIGQIFFNPLDKTFFLWDGNVWQPIGISAGAIVFAGTYDANLNEVASTTSEGAAIGLTAGDPLPAASNTNANYYLVVSEGGTGTSPAPAVALAPPDLILSNGASWLEIDVSSTYTAQTASNVAFTPAGQIGSTTVQAAIEEVSTECRNATNITSGTLAVDRGGTGTASYTKGDLLAASASTTLTKLGVGTNGQVLSADSTTATGLKWIATGNGTVTNVTGSGAISVANGTSTPAISVASASTSVAGVVQLSDSTSTTSSVLAATPTAVKAAYDLANAALSAAGGTLTGNLALDTGVVLVFEGATADAFETTLTVADPTADRTITLPNSTGTVALTSDLDDGTF